MLKPTIKIYNIYTFFSVATSNHINLKTVPLLIYLSYCEFNFFISSTNPLSLIINYIKYGLSPLLSKITQMAPSTLRQISLADL